jgi:hypothetical protein
MAGRDDPPRGSAAESSPRDRAASSLHRAGAASTAAAGAPPLAAGAAQPTPTPGETTKGWPKDLPPREPGPGTAREGDSEAKGTPEAKAPSLESESLFGVLQGLLHDLPGLVSDRVELFSLELKRASRALAQLAALAIAIAVLGVTAWIAIWVQVGVWLWQAGWPWLPVVLIVHAAAIWFAAMRARTLSHLLGLPATRRRLTVGFTAAAAAVAPPKAATTQPVRPTAATTPSPGASHG